MIKIKSTPKALIEEVEVRAAPGGAGGAGVGDASSGRVGVFFDVFRLLLRRVLSFLRMFRLPLCSLLSSWLCLA